MYQLWKAVPGSFPARWSVVDMYSDLESAYATIKLLRLKAEQSHDPVPDFVLVPVPVIPIPDEILHDYWSH